MEIERINIGNAEAVSAFEESLGFALPDDYKSFLKEYDGANFKDATFFIEEIQETIMMGALYGLTAKRGYGLIDVNNEYKEDIPERSLIIGLDPGGAFIMLICNGEDDGVYFYDHAYFFPSSTDECNTYFIASTFNEFLNGMKPS